MVAAPEADLLYPLSRFCRDAQRPLPEFETIIGLAMPEPYRSLLVHRGDMTSRLEEFHGSALHLRVLNRGADETAYWREVLLCKNGDEMPVEYGAIEIFLEAFEPPVRKLILEERLPLGGLLNAHGIRYRSEPRAFLQLAPDAAMSAFFGTPERTLYGRSNALLGGRGEVLARIVEVLRPDVSST